MSVNSETPNWSAGTFTGVPETELIGKLTALDESVPRVLDGVEATGDLEADALAELDAVQAGFRERRQRESERYELAVYADYWTCLCFATKAQRDTFLRAVGWPDLDGGKRYLDGRAVARHMGVEIPPDPDWGHPRRDGSLDTLAMTPDENREEVNHP